MVIPVRPEGDSDVGNPTGFAVRIYDEEGTNAGGTVAAAEWTTYWELTWDPVPGAVDYLIYYATAEGISSKPRRSAMPCWRLSVARGTGASTERNEFDWKAQLELSATLLQVIVVACFVDGSVGAASPRFPVGATLE
jgi:hypothetical protein